MAFLSDFLAGGKLRYQEFTSSGTFTPSAKLLANGGWCEAILVGGGQGGGSDYSGGGGETVFTKPFKVTGPMSVVIGAGGAPVAPIGVAGGVGGATHVYAPFCNWYADGGSGSGGTTASGGGKFGASSSTPAAGSSAHGIFFGGGGGAKSSSGLSAGLAGFPSVLCPSTSPGSNAKSSGGSSFGFGGRYPDINPGYGGGGGSGGFSGGAWIAGQYGGSGYVLIYWFE